jgi:hypothetical protein
MAANPDCPDWQSLRHRTNQRYTRRPAGLVREYIRRP